jgi:hypothetical protein
MRQLLFAAAEAEASLELDGEALPEVRARLRTAIEGAEQVLIPAQGDCT